MTRGLHWGGAQSGKKRTFHFHRFAWAALERKRGCYSPARRPNAGSLVLLMQDRMQSPPCSPFNRVYVYKRTYQQTAGWNSVLFSSSTLWSEVYHFQGQWGFGTAKVEKAALAIRTFGVIYLTYNNCVYVWVSGRLHSLPHLGWVLGIERVKNTFNLLSHLAGPPGHFNEKWHLAKEFWCLKREERIWGADSEMKSRIWDPCGFTHSYHRDSPLSLPLIPDGEEAAADSSYIRFKKNLSS